jgi:dihydrofolate reductase
MRKLTVTTMLTLDGVMQAPGGSDEDTAEGFEYGGWSMPFVDDEGLMVKADEVSAADLLLGRRTYEIFARYWPTDTESPIGKPFNDATKYVASRGRPSLDWGPAVVIEDAAEGVAALKAEDGPELVVHGSGNLARTLIDNGLVDEFHLWIFPVVIGKGKRLFDDEAVPTTLRLTDSKTSATGVFMGTYVPAGEVVTDPV